MDKALTIAALGDSITQASTGLADAEARWPRLLESMLASRHAGRSIRVINAGVGGESDREKMVRFERDVLAHRPDVVLLQFGGNNSGFLNPRRRVEPEETRRLLVQAQTRLSADTLVMAITFPPVIDAWHKHMRLENAAAFFAPWGGMDGAAERYREVLRDLACRHGWLLLDLSAEMRREADPGRYTLPDGVHLTPAGNQLLAALVHDCLAPHLEAIWRRKAPPAESAGRIPDTASAADCTSAAPQA